LSDDRAGYCHHLGIEVVLGAAELRRPNLPYSPQCEERHAGVARADHYRPFTPAQGKPRDPDDT
jgi:hypothetical protein